MVKQQQMQLDPARRASAVTDTHAGAKSRVGGDFRRWYPGFRSQTQTEAAKKVA